MRRSSRAIGQPRSECGLTIMGSPCRSILSRAAARTIFHRICELSGGQIARHRVIVRTALRKLNGLGANVFLPVAIRRQRVSGSTRHFGGALLVAAALAACAPQPEPRTVLDFMEDGLAREGVLTRCNQNRDATSADEECANARRASAAFALEAERARAAGLEQASESKLLALREGQARTAAAEQEATAAARAAAEAAYEARWRDPSGPRPPGGTPASVARTSVPRSARSCRR